ncbi:MAG TPA: DUF2382 domain-containing protein [Steroidobacteraceae bacterium]|jgi:uncharacterized protein (TIGR02271 family)|nr:DUF2382 domain-containing protein [Steroidobacteraceae bacterium]
MTDTDDTSLTVPLVQERPTVQKRTVETGRVRVRTVIDEHLARVSEELEHDEVTIEHVPIDREVTVTPRVREEDGVLIVPVLEEVLVVEKRLLLKEELHIRKKPNRERFEQAVTLRRMRAEVDRRPAPAPPPAQD